ncbi:hypothetical protein A2533_03235 [Candidatus Falkowbacteria bacterium RIFOXYD2_FULL_35_9]|uniref:RNA polymerase sigma factor 70 region 4 type 2 domain-containing protein n=1 Tax=Candidatus Falkowbacteria bacterium RIFOXYC2_FULL_36_12 TaxID=1798002 RepID=A0A1F5SXA9_9BACT|nr:MAG: hypothetical protein A2300_00700 [Candidatus Falkowbacteria bacterium RIFOXYB2_FULL_35_7]OGF30861.1 MAG: hypothetical protein A2478_00195 [Candidatus Falkowbacteria bacterium RIFOXYC2_FULL_36_12]OGF34240.1 MAG: hypothetical protein A2223_04555 [Candidatus Falkowbacteria bacterium RIFOXYA2_FULL_35_8]OGF48220.1 MAG: hypothetical protein A2533_03235 [Candidatus Falkowbacteria bacterium RIFOXYD2_FULL_35_9]
MKNTFKEKLLIFKVRHEKDQDAYGELYDYYVAKIFRFVMFKVRLVEDAEDITSEVFLKVWQYIRTTDKKIKNLNALFYQIARNAVIDYYRNKKRTEIQISDQEQYQKIIESRDLIKELDQKIDTKNIEFYLEKIKDEYREVLVLKYVEQYSVNEIAGILKKTKSNVRVLVHRALKSLRDVMGN